MREKPLIKMGWKRQAALVGIMLWSAHYHGGQWSREYRMGCRARALLERSNEIGSMMASRWFDRLEGYASGEGERPRVYTLAFSEAVKASYGRMVAIGEGVAA